MARWQYRANRQRKQLILRQSYQTRNSRFQWWKSPLQSNLWRLLNNPTKSNEPISLELSWAWKPIYKERARWIIQEKDPSIMFMAETWADKASLDWLQRNYNFEHKWVVESTWCEGLVLLLKFTVNLLVVDSSKYYIDALINKDTKEEWQFIGFYGEPETCRRHGQSFKV